MNCAFNAISALTRARYGCIVGSEPLRTAIRRAVVETVAVAQGAAVSLPEPALVDAAFQLGEVMHGALSSPAQDIARGKRTEIDSLNGFVGRRTESRPR